MSYFDDNTPRQSDSPFTGEFAAGNSECHFVRNEIPSQPWSDASYTPSDRATAVPKSYNCSESQPPKTPKAPKKRKGIPVGGIIALCLVCAILGGAGGGALVGGFMSRRFDAALAEVTAEATPEANNIGGSLVIPQTTPSYAQPETVVDGSALSPKAIYDIACAQVVAVTTEITYKNYFGFTTSSAVSGSGFIISTDGYILTNHHVIEEAAKGNYEISVLTHDGTEYIASIVGYEADNDVAVLKIDAEGLSAVTLGNSDYMAVGDTVYAVGNPLGELEYTMTGGMVSALDRDISTYDSSTGTYTSINMFQIDAAVNSGNSGGPVYDSHGQVIGIVTAKYSDTGVEGLGFAVPINDAVAIAEDLITKGYVSGKAHMGIEADTLPASVSQYYGLPAGAYVVSVENGSCAEKAGLVAGDIITAIDGVRVSSDDELISIKKNYRAGDTAEITVSRDRGDITLTITFDEEVPSANQQSQGGYNEYYGYGTIPGFGGFFG